MISLLKTSRLWMIVVCAALAPAYAAAPNVPADSDPAPAKKDYSPYPEPGAGYVTDIAGLLSRDGEERIEQWLWKTEKETGVEIAVVTIGSINLYSGAAGAGKDEVTDSAIERFATGLFNMYGIGNMPENNGVLLLVARRDRKLRIELGASYGRRRDSDAARIVQKVIIPQFKQDDYASGITAGVQAIMAEFADFAPGDTEPVSGDLDGYEPVNKGVSGKGSCDGRTGGGLRLNWWLLAEIGGAILALFSSVSLFQNGKNGWGWVVAGLGIVLTLAVVQTVVATMRATAKVSSSAGHSSSWSSGGFGGGFGGGFSGGGGSTGSW